MLVCSLVSISLLHSYSVVWLEFTVFIPPMLPFCNQPLGLQDGRIPDSAFTASSSYRERSRPNLVRLNIVTLDENGRFTGGWCPKPMSRSQWLQVDFGRKVNVTSIATQGKVEIKFWVTKYALAYQTSSGYLAWYTGTQDRNKQVANKAHTRLLMSPWPFY